MNRLLAYAIAATLVAAIPLSASGAVRIAGSDNTQLCGPDAPEGYKRPGGFCEQLDDWKSLVPTQEGCTPILVGDAAFDRSGRILVAIPIDPCCLIATSLDLPHLPPEGVLVAVSCLPPN
ncbi:MAG: hypothetical protein IPK28_17475 [Devosia sp.]|nr:hypothetical protein [Devosia sp.]